MTLAGPAGTPVGNEDAFTCAAAISSLIRRLGKDPDNSTNRSLALDAIRQSVEEFNLEMVDWWDRFATETVTFTETSAGSGIYNSDYALPSYFRRHVGRAWLNNTSGQRDIPVKVLGYQEFLAQVTFEGVQAGHPRVLTVLESRISNGNLRVWPTPGVDNVAIYPSMTFPVYLDIPICTDTGSALPVSSALSGAIFAKSLFILNDYIGQEERSARYERLAASMYIRAIAYNTKMKISNQSYLRGHV